MQSKNTLGVSEYIASTLGFSSRSHFIRVFKEHTGFTPGDFRKRYARD